MCCPLTTLVPSVQGLIPHLGQAGITTCPCVPDGADVQCVHLLRRPESRFVSENYEGSLISPLKLRNAQLLARSHPQDKRTRQGLP